VILAGILKFPILGRGLKAAEALFIDRSRLGNNPRLLSDAMEDRNSPPLAVAPEGKISKGDYVFRFRTGAFLTDKVIQPLTIRYKEFLPFANITLNSVQKNDLEWFWFCFCCPGAVCELTYLDSIPSEILEGKTPRERADMAQLIMANALGTLAISRSSHEIFTKREKE
jgi:1-acyl-sn-glycerol-3-phosphate acyltransferase